MKNYYRIMLGRKSIFADEAYKGNFIGGGWFPGIDLTHKLSENWRDFNKEMIPVYLKENPGKSRIAAGLSCAFLWTIAKGIQIGDVVLCPNGEGSYFVGEVTTNYSYHQIKNFPHQRGVHWFPKMIERSQMSQALQNSTGAIGTVSNITQYAEEIEKFIAGDRLPTIIATDESVENPSEFALEKHLEDFLVQNWRATELGKQYDIYEEDGEMIGQQYPSDTGPIDILAVSKDKKEIVIIELKKGRASDVVVGQVQRYMGYVKEELAEDDQSVRGIIIAFEDDIKINRALVVAPDIDFYTYKIHFKLEKK